MADYIYAFKKPFTDWRKLIIGAVLYMIPYINIITSIIASGYLLICAKNAINKDKSLPMWTDWLDLFLKGVVAIVIWAIFIIPVLVYILVFNLSETFYSILGGSDLIFMLANAGPHIIVSLVLAVVLSYVAPYGIMLYLDRDSFVEAFSLSEVFTKPFTLIYLKAWLLSVVFSVVIGKL